MSAVVLLNHSRQRNKKIAFSLHCSVYLVKVHLLTACSDFRCRWAWGKYRFVCRKDNRKYTEVDNKQDSYSCLIQVFGENVLDYLGYIIRSFENSLNHVYVCI